MIVFVPTTISPDPRTTVLPPAVMVIFVGPNVKVEPPITTWLLEVGALADGTGSRVRVTPPVVMARGPVCDAGRVTVVDPMTISPDPMTRVLPPAVIVDLLGPKVNVEPPIIT